MSLFLFGETFLSDCFSAHDPNFHRRQKISWKLAPPYDFFMDVHLAHVGLRADFLSDCFNTHDPVYYRRQKSYIACDFYRSVIWRTRTYYLVYKVSVLWELMTAAVPDRMINVTIFIGPGVGTHDPIFYIGPKTNFIFECKVLSSRH